MIKCGTTGQMTGLDRGENGAVECGNKADVLGGRFDELVSRDGNALRRGGDWAMSRGRYIPCSARNLARSWSARWRATSVCSGVKGGAVVGGAGLVALGV